MNRWCAPKLAAGYSSGHEISLESGVHHRSRLGMADVLAHSAITIVENGMLIGETIRLDDALGMPPREKAPR